MELHWLPPRTLSTWLEYWLVGRELCGFVRKHIFNWVVRDFWCQVWRTTLNNVVQLYSLEPLKEVGEVRSRGDTDGEAGTTSAEKEGVILCRNIFYSIRYFPFLFSFDHFCLLLCEHISSYSLTLFCNHPVGCFLQGLVATTGFHQQQHQTVAPVRWAGTSWLPLEVESRDQLTPLGSVEVTHRPHVSGSSGRY